MKLRELIMMEDGEAGVATTSGDIATVAYPLFVRGKSNKAKRKNARAAVGQKYVPGPKGVGTGVFEGFPLGKVLSFPDLVGQIEHILHAKNRSIGWKMSKRDDDVFLFSAMNDYNVRSMLIVAKVQDGWVSATNGFVDPFGKAEMLDKQELPMTLASASEIADEAISTYHDIDLSDYADEDEQGVAEGFDEAHVVGNDNVIYRLDRENPMSDTEVAVLGGAGRYSLKALRDKARREAAELAQDLSVEHGGAFRRSATNIKQLTNTINTIVAAYNELARLRRKGGRGSRGITDEDANFIRECIRVVEQATQNYRLMEGLTKEPDPKGYAKDKLTNPKYTIVVNTPGDLDWYKIGTYWHNKIIDPHEFGQDDSDTVMVAQGDEEYKEMLAKIKKMGLTYKIIGGTNDQPEIHDKA